MDQQEIDEFKEIFNLFDTDGSGIIDAQEINKAMSNQDLHTRNPVLFEVISYLNELDNSEIDFDTFIEAICEKIGNIKTKEGIARIFELYDTENTGHIAFDQLKRVARELGETLNDDELNILMHHVHVLNKTSSNDYFTQEDFFSIVTRDRTVRRMVHH